MARTHYFASDRVDFTWDAGHEPVITIAGGDTVILHTRDVSDNQIGPDSTAEVIAGLDWDRVYPLAGPIAVEGAQPGDTLAVEVLDVHFVDLRISEIVDAGRYVVSALLPLAVLEGS